ncbi:MAG: hypothetical protein ACPHL6_10130, partial [Rubripirellula sp.]
IVRTNPITAVRRVRVSVCKEEKILLFHVNEFELLDSVSAETVSIREASGIFRLYEGVCVTSVLLDVLQCC